MPRNVEAVVGAAIVIALASSMLWLTTSFLTPTAVEGPDFQPSWMWRYRGMDLVLLGVTIFVGVTAASVLFRSEQATA